MAHSTHSIKGGFVTSLSGIRGLMWQSASAFLPLPPTACAIFWVYKWGLCDPPVREPLGSLLLDHRTDVGLSFQARTHCDF